VLAAPKGSLQQEIEDLAATIRRCLDAQRLRNIDVRRFQGTPGLTGGVDLQKRLIDALKRQKIEHSPNAVVKCVGRFKFDKVINAVLIETDLLSSSGQAPVWRPIQTTIEELEDIAPLTGPTGRLAVSDAKQREKDSLAILTERRVHLASTPGSSATTITAALASADSPFAVELCRKDHSSGDYVAVPLTADNGMAFAELQLNDVYSIRIHNRSGRHMAAAVTIDGLNLFVISSIDRYRDFGKLIVPPRVTDIKGWHSTNRISLQFEVQQLPLALVATGSDASGRAPELDPVGTITVAFHEVALGPDGVLPQGEPEKYSYATGVGAPADADFREVQVKAVGELREVVSIRYSRP
jgi:hypothetical protein